MRAVIGRAAVNVTLSVSNPSRSMPPALVVIADAEVSVETVRFPWEV